VHALPRVKSIVPRASIFDPFHSHHAPYAYSLSSPPFIGRLFIDSSTWPADSIRSRVAQFNVSFLDTIRSPSHLVVFTDGSKVSSAAGYSVVGYYMGKIAFSVSIKLALITPTPRKL